uniref:Uncharacterized protein n=1 Tax=Anguilla anguilla TaxID=7936 RepID=A0A0E9R6X9_ANGAN
MPGQMLAFTVAICWLSCQKCLLG